MQINPNKNQANIYLFKVINRTTQKKCEKSVLLLSLNK